MVQVHVPRGVGVRVPPWAPVVLVQNSKAEAIQASKKSTALSNGHAVFLRPSLQKKGTCGPLLSSTNTTSLPLHRFLFDFFRFLLFLRCFGRFFLDGFLAVLCFAHDDGSSGVNCAGMAGCVRRRFWTDARPIIDACEIGAHQSQLVVFGRLAARK